LYLSNNSCNIKFINKLEKGGATMSVYIVNYFLKEAAEHNHDENCGCEEHANEHDENCGCEEHEHDEDCGCGGRDDSRLIGEIRSLGAWAHFMPEGFLLHTSLSSTEILEKLKVFVNSDDLLFVSKINSETTESLAPQVKEWISSKENS
jgi:hypothetical protein